MNDPRVLALIVVASLAACAPASERTTAPAESAPATTAASRPEDAPEAAVPDPAPGPVTPSVILDVGAVAGRPEGSVEAALGKPDACETVNPGKVGPARKCTYRGGAAEVVFIHDAADWITVNDTKGLKFEAQSLVQLGLPATTPAAQSPLAMVWKGVGGLREVTMFTPAIGSGDVSYFYVKAATE
ncbi:hypothetical protein L6R50_28045 [Myxococcota bacterium]|nr:hypothetical protein [Myxococcota bacterium]